MATTESLDASDRIEKAEGVNGFEEVAGAGKSEGSSAKAAEELSPSSATRPATSSKDVSPTRPDMATGATSARIMPVNGQNSTTTLNMPHPKKFSHIDINKRFLEKNSPASSTGHTTSPSLTSKPGSSILSLYPSVEKPAIQTTASHSRLVTAKLTADIQRSSTTGPGWSRPSSASSSTATAPSGSGSGSGSVPAPKPLSTSTVTHAAPQLPTVGKVIQPQPRGAIDVVPLVRKESAGKPAWGSAKPAAVVQSRPETTSTEFPTAAEVAQASKHVEKEKKAMTQPDDDKKQPVATNADADAFRGVHLGPNVHHWDEDEGDDSNFLDEVIQFEDGRQYTVQTTQDASDALQSQPPSELTDDTRSRHEEPHNIPVSKEERFADDFDRSWPPSRQQAAKHSTEPAQQPLSPSVSSQSMHSPQDASRVLFNERSNRLEPYSSSRFSGPSRDSYFSRRGSRSDAASSPVEPKGGREGPVQLLQKAIPSHRDNYSEDRSLRGPRTGDRGGFAPPHENSRFRDRDVTRRDFAGPPHMSRTATNGSDNARSRDQFDRHGGPSDKSRRMSNVSSSHLSPVDPSREGRQLPPHLSGPQPSPSMWRAPSTSERSRRLSTTSSVGAPLTQPLSHSPASSHAPLSPALGDSVTVSTPAVDIDEVRKAAMQSAAERARLRRQQEEEEREKQRERARQKAAEIEAKLKEEKEKLAASESTESIDSEVVSIIEDAVRSVSQPTEVHLATVLEDASISASPRPGAVRAPSSRGRAPLTRRPSIDVPSPATGIDSWRSSKAMRARPSESQPPSAPSAPAQLPPSLAEYGHLSLTGDENLEIVDFSEHGKLIGVHVEDSVSVEPASTSTGIDVSHKRPQRPVATDFFQDHQDTAVPASVGAHSWRRRSSAARDVPPQMAVVLATQTTAASEATQQPPSVHSPLRITTGHPYTSGGSHLKSSVVGDDGGHAYGDQSSEHAHPHTMRSPTTPYREAPMAALDDTMARIKGALDGLHKPDIPKKWLPPPLRTLQAHGDMVPRPHRRNADHDEHHVKEVFDVTGYEPPRSPKPAWNHFAVKVPRASHERQLLSPEKLRFIGTYAYTRLDVLSLVPPFDQPRQRGFSLNVNDLLFPRPFKVKGRTKFNVKLPHAHLQGGNASPTLPVVNLPSKPSNSRISVTGAFGRNREADGSSSWRKPPSSPLRQQNDLLAPPVGELDTTSRSPPPDMPSRLHTEPGQSHMPSDSPVIAVPLTKSKTQPKSDEVPAVAFYRDSPSDVSWRQASPAVKFLVNSELEEESSSQVVVIPAQEPTAREASTPSFPTLALVPVNIPVHEQPLQPEPISSSKDPIVEFRKGNRSPVQGPITPPTQSGNLPSLTWAAQREAALKESPSRPPDPEHLKAVWLATSNKPEKPSVNSLRGIADDLNAPLAIQDAKMEDIPTPPAHASTQASRMSIMHDITRTFQQVPTSSASAPQSASSLPQSSNGHGHSHMPVTSPSQRQTQLPPSTPASMRVPYGGYHSPMMSSPSPTLVYPPAMTPSPIPQPMMVNGQYAQPMWVSVHHPNGPPGMMRSMASPYGPQLVPYPPAGAMYQPPPNMQGPGFPPSPSMQGRPANVMLAPSGSQGQPGHHPMYATSPVMMHAMPAMTAPAQSYPGSAQSRGPHPHPPPPRGAYDPHHVPGGMQPSPSFAPPQSPAYNHVPPNMFARPPW